MTGSDMTDLFIPELDFVGGCGTTHAILGIGEVHFPAGGKIELNTTNFPKREVDMYFDAVVGFESVPGVDVRPFDIDTHGFLGL